LSAIDCDYIHAENGLGKLALYSADKERDIIKFIEANKHILQENIHQCGGVLLRNFNIRAVSEFNHLAQAISPNLLDYVNRSTPRTKLGGKIYTATEYPAHKHILLHNENAYTQSWPKKIMFFCVIVPESGGETPIADSRQVFNKIDKKIITKFNQKKVMYKRNYSAGIDLSWQDVFQTTEKTDVEDYCNKNNIQYHWHEPGSNGLELTTQQICQATVKHPVTQEDVWFNQAHLFHVSSLDEADKHTLLSIVTENNLPRNVFHGDGSDIQVDDLHHILDVYQSEKIVFQWKRGDVMMLDNVLMAHGRNPFIGERKIVVAMSGDE